jgi:hypothetical protein
MQKLLAGFFIICFLTIEAQAVYRLCPPGSTCITTNVITGHCSKDERCMDLNSRTVPCSDPRALARDVYYPCSGAIYTQCQSTGFVLEPIPNPCTADNVGSSCRVVTVRSTPNTICERNQCKGCTHYGYPPGVEPPTSPDPGIGKIFE